MGVFRRSSSRNRKKKDETSKANGGNEAVVELDDLGKIQVEEDEFLPGITPRCEYLYSISMLTNLLQIILY